MVLSLFSGAPQLFPRRPIAIENGAVKVGFKDHFRQKIDQIVEAPFAFPEIAGTLDDLLFKITPVKKQIEREDKRHCGEEQDGENIEERKDDLHVLASVESADDGAVVTDFLHKLALADQSKGMKETREASQGRSGDPEEKGISGNRNAEELIILGTCGEL
jgi:hypothetical protein